MATVRNFEDLEIWKNSRSLTKQVYEDFLTTRDFGFKDQIQRAAVSIMNNIAEGFCRGSDAEFRNAYFILCLDTKNEARKVKTKRPLPALPQGRNF